MNGIPPISTVAEDKTYDLCLGCKHRGHTCDGPNFFAMTHQRRVEWCNALKKIRGLTNAQIAEQAVMPDGSKLSKATVDSILSGRTQDVKTSTWAAILRVLIGGCWGQYPCHLAALLMEGQSGDPSRVDELKKDVAYLQGRISLQDGQIVAKDRQIEELRAQVADWKALAKRRNSWIVALATALSLVMVAFLTLLI